MKLIVLHRWAITRAGIKATFRNSEFAEPSTVDEVESGADCAIVEPLHFPGAVEALSRTGVPVVVLTADESDIGPVTAIKDGAVGYVHMSQPLRVLQEVVASAVTGSPRMDVRAIRTAMTAASKDRQTGLETVAMLSAREIETLKLLATGMKNTSIASALGVSGGTAEKYVNSVYRKLGLVKGMGTPRVLATLRAIRAGLITSEDSIERKEPT